jgi:uncharacterized protein YaaN involved in tellurite resistance
MAFTMEIANEDEIRKEIERQVEVAPEEEQKLWSMAVANAEELMTAEMESIEKKRALLSSVESFGLDSMESSARKNALLQVTVRNFSDMGDDGGVVGKGLLDLQREIKDLDPSLIDFAKTGILGKLFNPIRAYFDKYQKAEDVIADIVESLAKGKATLKNDNTTLEIEQEALRSLTKKLMKEVELGTMMDKAIEERLDAAKAASEDEEKVRFVSEEILFPLRQRLMDMQQMIVVNQQGIMAIEVVKRNNKELMRGVDRAKNVTVSAMKIAVIVASALYNQKIVLKKIELLNATTNELISSTSKMLKEQGADIHKQAMDANISVETLKTAFSDVIDAMNAISAYKQEALPRMKSTISQFRELAQKGEEQIERMEKGNLLSNRNV